MTELVLRGVTFGYGPEPLLKDVSFTLDRPELVCVIGPNGVGKTTLVKCINKLLKPDSGSVTLPGRWPSCRTAWTPCSGCPWRRWC